MKLKKTAVFAAAVIMLLTAVGVPFKFSAESVNFTPSAKEMFKGDINCDGFVSSEDVKEFKKILLTERESKQKNADVNGDGKWDVIDLAAIKKYISSVLPQIFVSEKGDDSADGTRENPVATLNRALELVSCGGKIIICDTVTLDSEFRWQEHSKAVEICGGVLDCSQLSSLKVRDAVCFDNINIIFKGGCMLYACGHRFKMGADALVKGEIVFFGGEYSDPVASTDVTLLSGNYSYIYGGGNYADVKGDIKLHVGGKVNNEPLADNFRSIFGGSIDGTVHGNICVTADGEINKEADVKSHEAFTNIFGGCNAGTVKGDIELNIGEDTKFNYVFGGNAGENSDVEGAITVNFSGTAMSVAGGSSGADLNCDTTVNINGGAVEQVFGGCENAAQLGNAEVNLLGGAVTRRVYGGCYNQIKRRLALPLWQGSHHVKGNTTVRISEDVTLDFSNTSGSNDDLGVSASSRHRKNFEDENSKVIFLSEKAKEKYSGSLGIRINNPLADFLLNFSAPYDECQVLSKK